MRHLLGISAHYHDSAAALVRNGVIVAAAQEERFTRRKNDDAFPVRAVEYCLSAGGIGLGQLDGVVFYDKPIPKFARFLETALTLASLKHSQRFSPPPPRAGRRTSAT